MNDLSSPAPSSPALSSAAPAIEATPADGYAGDVTCTEAHRIVASDPAARIVDVRTKAEWTFVGAPDLSPDSPLGLVEWQTFPGGAPNDAFLTQLQAVTDPKAPVFFLCRSGARSASAARRATEAGYAQAFNIDGGFEGPLDGAGQRGTVAGWKAEGLPWRQS